MISLTDESPFLPYEEKDQGGIVLRDTNGVLLIHTWYPQRVYENCDATPPEKLRQIAPASVRAYRDGPQTMPARQQILVHYLNFVPLSAKAGVGEVNGIGDGLAAWYGRDFRHVILIATLSTGVHDK